ncbi:uncharacterized protein [Choristoneura fumiferana]|uniref:uncharacterized protein n=1 Tax=Choristoneura fumiferana TaxID=7141 RepID=UPI003D15D2D3
MAANIVVTGLPADSQFRKVMYTFKAMFKKIQIKKFWIRELSETYGADEKQMIIDFDSDSDARKACNYLDNYPFPHPTSKQEYLLSALINDDPTEMVEYQEDRRSNVHRQRRRDRRQVFQRSPSPGYQSEASKLDMEIELLRKQRQVIEEERRLLLERKKLDMIREYGPSATRDFMDFDDLEPPRKRRMEPAHTEVKKSRKQSPPPPKPNMPRITNTLPTFFQPCKKLIAEMKEYIEQDTTPEEKEILIKLIRAALRKNLAIALDGKGYMRAAEVTKLYREKHPKTGDEAFVKKILANIRASYLPDELEQKLASVKKEPKGSDDESPSGQKEVGKGEKSLENPSDDNKVGENEDKQEVSEAESQDKTNEENKTDADQTDFSVDVNPDSSKTNDKLVRATTEELPKATNKVTAEEPDTTAETTEAKYGDTADEPSKSEENAESQKTEDGGTADSAVQS